jgi:hypothetical protein
MKVAGPTRRERISRSQSRHPASERGSASGGILAERGLMSVTGDLLAMNGRENG